MNGLPHYFAIRPSEEDDDSIERHRLSMIQEISESQPDQEKIDRLMALTFADRRQFIVVKGAPLQDVLESYPVLKLKDEVMN